MNFIKTVLNSLSQEMEHIVYGLVASLVILGIFCTMLTIDGHKVVLLPIERLYNHNEIKCEYHHSKFNYDLTGEK